MNIGLCRAFLLRPCPLLSLLTCVQIRSFRLNNVVTRMVQLLRSIRILIWLLNHYCVHRSPSKPYLGIEKPRYLPSPSSGQTKYTWTIFLRLKFFAYFSRLLSQMSTQVSNRALAHDATKQTRFSHGDPLLHSSGLLSSR